MFSVIAFLYLKMTEIFACIIFCFRILKRENMVIRILERNLSIRNSIIHCLFWNAEFFDLSRKYCNASFPIRTLTSGFNEFSAKADNLLIIFTVQMYIHKAIKLLLFISTWLGYKSYCYCPSKF